MPEGPRLSRPHVLRELERHPQLLAIRGALRARKVLGWPKRRKLAHAFLWEYS